MFIYNFIKYLVLHLKYTKILNVVYKDENLLENLSNTFKVNFKKDWTGRIYAIFNPYIQTGIFDQSDQIFEYTNEGISNKMYVESYILKQLSLIQFFIKANNLFDLLTYKLEKVDEYDNYLFIMQPITWDDCAKYTKRFIYFLLGLLIFVPVLIYLYTIVIN